MRILCSLGGERTTISRGDKGGDGYVEREPCSFELLNSQATYSTRTSPREAVSNHAY